MVFRSSAAICGAVVLLGISVTVARSEIGAVHSSAVVNDASGDAIVGAASTYNPFGPGWQEGGPDTRYVYDAPHDPAYAAALLRLMLDGATATSDWAVSGEPAGSIHPAKAVLADFFPGSCIALKRVGLGLLLVPHLLVEPAGDHLVRHCLGDAELGERLHLVGHDLVTGCLDRSQHLFDRSRPLHHR